MKLKWLSRNEIDDARWNDAIAGAANSLPYAFTWYLDVVCNKHWCALVDNDYRLVMPVPVAKKWGVPFVYQPFFCQQLGIFYKTATSHEQSAFLHALRKRFLFVQYQFNYTNCFEGNTKKISSKKNFVLPLDQNFETLRQAFSQNTKRNIAKAERSIGTSYSLQVATQENLHIYLAFYIAHAATRDPNFKPAQEKILEKLVEQLIQHNMLHWFELCTSNKTLVALVGLLMYKQRLTHLLPATNELGRSIGAMHLLTSKILEHFTQQNLLYDFEGSSVASIAHFYKSFGAHEQNYLSIEKNLWW